MATVSELRELKDFIFTPPSEVVDWELDSNNMDDEEEDADQEE